MLESLASGNDMTNNFTDIVFSLMCPLPGDREPGGVQELIGNALSAQIKNSAIFLFCDAVALQRSVEHLQTAVTQYFTITRHEEFCRSVCFGML